MIIASCFRKPLYLIPHVVAMLASFADGKKYSSLKSKTVQTMMLPLTFRKCFIVGWLDMRVLRSML